MPEITTFLTYESKAEEAVHHYVSIFDGRIKSTMGPKEKPFSLTFEILGKTFIAMNGGPSFSFTSGVSLFVGCETQEEIDRYWAKLLEGGGKEVQCGWLTDAWGVSWQIIPNALGQYLGGKDAEGAGRAMKAMLKMKKLDIATLKRAYEGG